jgi:hypothetical protein
VLLAEYLIVSLDQEEDPEAETLWVKEADFYQMKKKECMFMLNVGMVRQSSELNR